VAVARLPHPRGALALLFFLASLAACPGAGASDSAIGAAVSPVPERLRWVDGVYRWHYNRALEPDWLAPGAGLYLFRQAAESWLSCGLRIEFAGETDQTPGRMDGLNVAGWSVSLLAAQRGLTMRRRAGESLVEADVMVSSANAEMRISHELLRKVILHEFGHALGLVHSADCGDVMSFGAACRGIPHVRLPSQLAKGDLLQCAKRYRTEPAPDPAPAR